MGARGNGSLSQNLEGNELETLIIVLVLSAAPQAKILVILRGVYNGKHHF